MAASDPGLSVVIGCDGTPGQLQPYFQRIMGPGDCTPHHDWLHVDLRHTHLVQCPHENYVQADAKTWKPLASRQISRVFMELFPSQYVRTSEDLDRLANRMQAPMAGKEFEEMLRLRGFPQEEAKAAQVLCPTAISNIKRLMLENRMSEEDFTTRLYEEISALSDDPPSYNDDFKLTLASVIAVELYMLQNQAHSDSGIQKFLRENGFKDIRVERVAENPYNGRKNSWMITATRDDRPIITAAPAAPRSVGP